MKLIKENLGKASVTIDKNYWDINKYYPKLLIIENKEKGICFISRKPVPAGTSIYNRNYWIPLGKMSSESEESNVTITADSVVFNRGNIYPTLTLTSKYNASKIQLKRDGEVIYESSGTKVTFMDSFIENQAKSIIYSADFIIDDETFTVTCVINIVNGIYCGAELNYTDVINSAHLTTAKLDVKGEYEIDNAEDENYIWFIIPNDLVITNVTLNGMYFPISCVTATVINDINYDIYRSENTYDKCRITLNVE